MYGITFLVLSEFVINEKIYQHKKETHTHTNHLSQNQYLYSTSLRFLRATQMTKHHNINMKKHLHISDIRNPWPQSLNTSQLNINTSIKRE